MCSARQGTCNHSLLKKRDKLWFKNTSNSSEVKEVRQMAWLCSHTRQNDFEDSDCVIFRCHSQISLHTDLLKWAIFTFTWHTFHIFFFFLQSLGNAQKMCLYVHFQHMKITHAHTHTPMGGGGGVCVCGGGEIAFQIFFHPPLFMPGEVITPRTNNA